MYIISIFVKVNYLRKYRNRFVTKIEIVSAMDDSSFLISPPDGFTDKTPVEYNGIYFTLSSAKLSQKSKLTSSGMVYTTTFEFSFPNFSGADLFMLQFQKISEIKITYNTKAEIRLNKNDIALNSPFEVEFESNSKTIYFSTQIIQIYPIKFNEQ